MPYSLFSAYGIELEYMIVDAETLDVRPICDKVMYDVAGEYLSEIEMGEIAWSNELALHVIELKTNGPAAQLDGLAEEFQSHVHQINERLKQFGARLLPTAMHPWMNPDEEMQLWPHEYSPVYEAFHRIFDCRGHGWANLQSVHVNLPFNGDEEFGRLHAAIRLILPLLPALAASSPIVEGQFTGTMDNRLDVYRFNARRIPSVSGQIIPEPAFDEASYRNLILEPMYADIAPFDPEETLRDEFLNARGAIARFGRGSIEIRLLDIQESPRADLAICAAVCGALQLMVAERWTPLGEQKMLTTERLHRILLNTIRDAGEAAIDDPDYLRQFGIESGLLTAAEVWDEVVQAVAASRPDWSQHFRAPLELIGVQGTLAKRIRKRLPDHPPKEAIASIYRELADCLAEGQMFNAE